jgi:hypothetical protein
VLLRTRIFRGIQAAKKFLSTGLLQRRRIDIDPRMRPLMKQSEVDDPDFAEEEDGEESGDNDDEYLADDIEGDDVPEDTVVFSAAKNSDNVGELSVEINVEELIAEFESAEDAEAARRKEIRRRLEEIREQREAMKELEDTFSFDMNDDD